MARTRDQDYKTRLGAVLRGRDPEALHLFLRQSAAGYGDQRQVSDVESRGHDEMEELMHRMILARPDLSDLHTESRTWLAARGEPGRTLPAPPRSCSPAGLVQPRSRRRRRPRR